MEVIRTRIVVVPASSAVLASGFDLTAVAPPGAADRSRRAALHPFLVSMSQRPR